MTRATSLSMRPFGGLSMATAGSEGRSQSQDSNIDVSMNSDND